MILIRRREVWSRFAPTVTTKCYSWSLSNNTPASLVLSRNQRRGPGEMIPSQISRNWSSDRRADSDQSNTAVTDHTSDTAHDVHTAHRWCLDAWQLARICSYLSFPPGERGPGSFRSKKSWMWREGRFNVLRMYLLSGFCCLRNLLQRRREDWLSFGLADRTRNENRKRQHLLQD